MELTAAIAIVTQDVHASYPHLSRPLAIQHALNVTSVDTLDWDGHTAPAYQAVHEAHVGELVLNLASALKVSIDDSDVWVSTDGAHATVDGMDAFEWLDAVGCLA